MWCVLYAYLFREYGDRGRGVMMSPPFVVVPWSEEHWLGLRRHSHLHITQGDSRVTLKISCQVGKFRVYRGIVNHVNKRQWF